MASAAQLSGVAAELEALLHTTLSSENTARAQAEARLTQLGKNAAVVPPLLELLQRAAAAETRQLAALLLRKRLAALWPQLPPQTRESLKTALLEAVVREPASNVRRASAGVVSVVAKEALPAGEWPALLPFLHSCTQSPDELHRELALVVFLSLTETVGDVLRPHYTALAALFGGAAADASPRVRIGALRALSELCKCVSDDAEAASVCAVVPAILAAGVASLTADEEEGSLLVFEVLSDMVESPAKLLAGHLPAIVELCLGAALQEGRDVRVRASALSLVSWVAHYKPRQLLKNKLVEQLLQAVCPLCAEEDEAEEGEEEEDEEEAARRALRVIACQVVDALSNGLPAKHVAPTVLAFAAANLGAAEAERRRAALTALAFAAEGCATAMRPLTRQLVPPVAAALRDGAAEVRAAAAFALAQFCEHWEDAKELHDQALPLLLAALGDSDRAAAERVLYAVDEYMCVLEGEELAPHLPLFLSYLMQLLDAPAAPPKLQEMALAVAASAADSSGRAFHPFMHALLPRLQRCMCLTSDEGLPVRARALECLGNLMAAPGGRAAFAPLLPDAMAAAAAGFELDYSELREYGHGFYAAAAACARDQLAPWLPGVVAQALASLALDDGYAGGGGSDDDGGDSDSEGSDAVARRFSIRTGVLDEKSAAVCALGCYARHCGAAFAPHLERVLPVLLTMSRYFHEQVRQQAYDALARSIACAYAAGATPAPATIDAVFSAVATGAETESDKEACAAALEAGALLMDACGGASSAPHLSRFAAVALAVLSRSSRCHEAEEGSDSGDDTDDECDEEAAEERLLVGVSEVLPALARAMGAAAFIPLFGSALFAALMKRGGAGAPEGERAEVSATLVEIARALGPACAPCVPLIMPFLLREMASPAAGNRRNAVFLAGVMLSEAGAAAAPHLQPMLSAVEPLLGAGEKDGAVRDNAAACIARLLAAPPAPLPERELVAALLAALPLTRDLEELPAVYASLCTILRRQEPHLLDFVPRTLVLFSQLASTPAGDDQEEEAAAQLAAALRDVGATLSSLLKAGGLPLSALDEPLQRLVSAAAA